MKKQTYLEFIQTLLPKEEFLAFKECYQSRIPKSIKIIQSRIDKDYFFKIASELNRTLVAPQLSNGEEKYDDVLFLKKEDKTTLGSSFLHTSGLFYSQEVAAGLSAQVLSIEEGDIVLDLCAAPGGKTIQLADKLLQSGGGFLLANEPSDPRRKALVFNINRCGTYNTAISGYDGTCIGDLAPETFDKVLVDAPCSGEGMQYKADKTVTYRDPKSAEKLSKLQKQLLISGLKALKVGGELVYSTCTLNPLENEEVIRSVMDDYPDALELVEVSIDQKSIGNSEILGGGAKKIARFWPHIQKTGGFFIAKLKKIAKIPYSIKADKRVKVSNRDASNELQTKIRNYLKEEWGIEKKIQYSFFASSQAIYCSTAIPELGNIFIEKIGIPIIKLGHNQEYIPQQGLVTVFGNQAKKNIFELTSKILQSLSERGQYQGVFGPSGSFLITQLDGKGIFLVKQVGEYIKAKN